jgi:hypothetical protein
MHCVDVTCVRECSIDGWPYEESAPHSRTCRVFAHRQRPHAIARVRKNIHAYPFTFPDFASIDIHIYVHGVCHVPTRARDGDGRIVGARNRTHVCTPLRWRAAGPEAAHTLNMFDTDAVFHAPMFALNTDAAWNACAPKPHAVRADGRPSHVSARMRGRPMALAHTRARARTQHVDTCARRARIGDPFVGVA